MRRKRGIRGNLTKIGVLCLALLLGMGSLTLGYAAWTDPLAIGGTVTTGEWTTDQEGSMGFWKNWDNHYGDFGYGPKPKPAPPAGWDFENVVEGWLGDIFTDSCWLIANPSSGDFIAAMQDILKPSPPKSAQDLFLVQFMATRLNAWSGWQGTTSTRNISGYGATYYLGLGDYATLGDIITAIEDVCKYGPFPTSAQFSLMQDLCEDLNTLTIP